MYTVLADLEIGYVDQAGLKFRDVFIFNVCVCVCEHNCRCSLRPEVLDSLELKLQVAMNHLVWCWEPNSGPLEYILLLLTTGSSP